MNTADFIRDEYNTFNSKTNVWNMKNVEIHINLPDNTKGKEEDYLLKYIASVNEKIEWIHNNRKKIEKALIDDDIISLAEDWAAGAEKAEDEEQECYLMEDGEKVFLPISPEAFCKSLYFEAIVLSFDEPIPEAELILLCKPDYFAGHCIMVTITTDNQIECNGLAG